MRERWCYVESHFKQAKATMSDVKRILIDIAAAETCLRREFRIHRYHF